MEDIVADLSASVDTASVVESAPEGTANTDAGATPDSTTDIDDGGTSPDELGLEDELGEPENIEAPAEDPEDSLAEEPAAQPAEEPKPAEDLPEGVEHKITREGKHKYYLPEQVYKQFQGAHENAQRIAEIIGEDVTPEAIQDRHNAMVAQERLYADLLSGDPAVQTQIVEHFLEQSRAAVENGEVAGDPMLTFTEAMLDTLAKQHPDADARILTRTTRRVFDDFYDMAADLAAGRSVEQLQAAAQAGDASAKQALNLLFSTQQLDNHLFKSFRKAGELQPRTSADPLAAREAQIRARESELQKRDAASATERWQKWHGNTGAQTRSAIGKEIDAALAEAKEQYAKYPDLLKRVSETLQAKAFDGIKADKKWSDLISIETAKARRAASEQVRAQIAQTIVNRYANKARQIIAAHKTAVLREAVTALKAQSDATHQRRTAAAQHRAPTSGGVPVNRGIMPNPKSGNFEYGTVDNLLQDLNASFAGR